METYKKAKKLLKPCSVQRHESWYTSLYTDHGRMPTETSVRAPEKAVLCITMNPSRATYPQSNELTRGPLS